jgi:hypothetical protein
VLQSTRFLTATVILVTALCMAGCESSGKDYPKPNGASAATLRNVEVINPDTLLKTDQNLVVDIIEPNNPDRRFSVLFGPYPDAAGVGSGSVMSTSPEFSLTGGYGHYSGFWPLGHTVRVRAAAEGCAFILQIDAAADTHRVFVTGRSYSSEKIRVYTAAAAGWQEVTPPLTDLDSYYEFTVDATGAVVASGIKKMSVDATQQIKDFVSSTKVKAGQAGVSQN